MPVPAIATTVLKMNRALGTMLSLLAAFLVISMAGVMAAAVREADLKPGAVAGRDRKHQGLVAGVVTLVFMGLLLWSGLQWWNMGATAYAYDLYRPLDVQPVLQGNTLDLRVSGFVAKNNYMRTRLNSDFLPDHGHLMHLYMIHEPEMDAVYHVHPELVEQGDSGCGCRRCRRRVQALWRCGTCEWISGDAAGDGPHPARHAGDSAGAG